MSSLEDMETAIRSKNMRVTPQRRAVMLYLQDNSSHPTVESVARHMQEVMPNVALSTVYSILNEFAELGLLLKIELGGAMRFDPQTKPHGHYYCSKCGEVFDVELKDALVKNLETSAAGAGLNCEHIAVSFSGVCPHCSH